MSNKDGGREAEFGELYRSHLSAIARYATRRTSPDDAIDAVAETFVVAWRRFEEIPPGSATLPWLFGVARRVLANQRRGNVRRHRLHDRLCAEWIRPVANIEASDLSPLGRALERLSEPDRDVLLMAGVEELSPAEIAAVLDVSPEVARNRLSRARARLRGTLAEIRTTPAGHLPKKPTNEGDR